MSAPGVGDPGVGDPGVDDPAGADRGTAVRTTRIGSWPGTDFELALRIGFAETPDGPVLPELPDRGPEAAMIGRAGAFLVDLDLDLQPSGWRLHRGRSAEQRRARRLLRDDLDRLEEFASGYTGPLTIAVAGPWTLAATVELPRGEKVLADPGAGRDLAASLAEGIAQLDAELSRRLPAIRLRWQLDEPALPGVHRGEVGTASGLNRYRSVETPELLERLDLVFAAVGDGWLHSCGADVPVPELLLLDGVGLSLDAELLTDRGWDAVGAGLDAGRTVALGFGGGSGSGGEDRGVPDADATARALLRRWESLGLDATPAGGLWLTPSCGLAGLTERDAVATLRALRTAAGIVTEELGGR